MSIEKSYQPSSEERQKAEDMLTEEQRGSDKERQETYFAGYHAAEKQQKEDVRSKHEQAVLHRKNLELLEKDNLKDAYEFIIGEFSNGLWDEDSKIIKELEWLQLKQKAGMDEGWFHCPGCLINTINSRLDTNKIDAGRIEHSVFQSIFSNSGGTPETSGRMYELGGKSWEADMTGAKLEEFIRSKKSSRDERIKRGVLYD